MRWIFGVVCFALVSVASAQSVEVDRFTGVTKIRDTVPGGQWNPSLMLSAMIKGGRVQSLSIGIVSQSDEWKYLKCNNTHWLLNGKPLPLPQPDYDGDVLQAGGVMEFMWTPVTLAQLKRISVAESFEYKICSDEVTVDAEGLESLQDFSVAVEAALSK